MSLLLVNISLFNVGLAVFESDLVPFLGFWHPGLLSCESCFQVTKHLAEVPGVHMRGGRAVASAPPPAQSLGTRLGS